LALTGAGALPPHCELRTANFELRTANDVKTLRNLGRAARALGVLLAAGLATGGCASGPGAPQGGEDPVVGMWWWQGNLHTHSLWSDGEDFPEMIAAWYRERGYHFVVFTEHDRLQEGGDFWVDIAAEDPGWPPRKASTRAALEGYRARFGPEWVGERREGARHLVRLRPLSEYRHLFEEPGRFLLIMGEEITDREGAHVNALGLTTAILPRGGAGPADRTRNNLAAVAEQRASTGQRIPAVINHPNYLWSLTAEEIAAMPDARLFELYNGHLHGNNEGDAVRAGTERMWDVMLALRHEARGAPIFGIAADDAHHYRSFSEDVARPGRGWVMVRAAALSQEHLLAALEAGDFYASTGITLRAIDHDNRRLHIEIDAEPGVSYRTYFIGTRTRVSMESRPVLSSAGDTLRTTRMYDPAVGEILAEAHGPVAEYVFRGDERYVRARVVSSRPHIDPTTGDTLGPAVMAWTQPVFRGR
jgi:hypothetical protein